MFEALDCLSIRICISTLQDIPKVESHFFVIINNFPVQTWGCEAMCRIMFSFATISDLFQSTVLSSSDFPDIFGVPQAWKHSNGDKLSSIFSTGLSQGRLLACKNSLSTSFRFPWSSLLPASFFSNLLKILKACLTWVFLYKCSRFLFLYNSRHITRLESPLSQNWPFVFHITIFRGLPASPIPLQQLGEMSRQAISSETNAAKRDMGICHANLLEKSSLSTRAL